MVNTPRIVYTVNMESFELLSQITFALFHTDDFDNRINTVLRLTGNHARVSRTYVFLDGPDGQTTSNTHEWCDTGIAPQKKQLQNIPYAEIPSWRELLEREGRVYSENIRELPEDLVAILEPQGIRSIIVYPLMIEESVRGFIGFDECRKERKWSEDDLQLLKSVSGFLSTVFERKLFHQALIRSEKNFKTLFNTIEDLLIIADAEGRILHTNRAVREKLGYTLEELVKMTIPELHPEEKREEAARIVEEMLAGQRTSCPLEIKRKNGSRFPVDTRIWLGNWDGRECLFGISKDLSVEQEALQKFTKLFENNPALMAISGITDRKITEVNRAFLDKTGYTRSEVVGKTSEELQLFSSDQIREEIAERLLKNKRVSDLELAVRCKDGRLLSGLFSGEIINTQAGEFFLTVMVDISELKRLQQVTDNQRKRLSLIIEATGQGTWEWNVQTGETVFNENWARIVGYRLQELEPVNIDTWLKLAHPEDLKVSEKLLQDHFSGELDLYDYECRMKHKSGRWIWVHDRGRVVERDAEGKPLWMFGTHEDITEKRELQEKIRQLSVRDPLTGVYNRRYLFGRIPGLIQEYLRERNPFSLTMLDIDHFKILNDTYGHLAGDYILKELMVILKVNIRPYDILARYGGEEFIIVSLNTDREQTLKVISRILEIVRERVFTFSNEKIRFTFSAGVTDVSEFEDSRISDELLIQKADERLYRAKNEGRNRIV